MVLVEAVALFDYEADDENHLSIRAGERLTVLKQEDSGWWSGTNDYGQTGWFPASYVELITAPSIPDDPPPLPADSPSFCGVYLNPSTLSNSKAPSTAAGKYGAPRRLSKLSTKSHWTEYSVTEGTTPTDTYAHQFDSRRTSVADFDNGMVEIDMMTRNASQLSLASETQSIRSLKQLTFKDPAAVPVADEYGKYTYENNFWSDKGDKSGFDVLVLKHRNGKEVCKDFAHLMHERARIEEQYARQLLELGKSQLGETETSGTAKTAWNQLKFDIKTQAESRLKFAQKITEEVQKPILNFKNEQKKMRKNYENTIAADRKVLLAKFALAQKAYKNYISRAKEADLAETLVKRAQVTNMNRKDFIKIEENAKKERKKASMASYDYKTAVDEYEEIRSRWEEDMRSACAEFQSAEEDRIQFLKSVLQSYLSVQKEVNTECKESSEMCGHSIESVSPHVDIEMFVKTSFTGSQKPIQLKYEPYKGVSF